VNWCVQLKMFVCVLFLSLEFFYYAFHLARICVVINCRFNISQLSHRNTTAGDIPSHFSFHVLLSGRGASDSMSSKRLTQSNALFSLVPICVVKFCLFFSRLSFHLWVLYLSAYEQWRRNEFESGGCARVFDCAPSTFWLFMFN